MGIGGHVPSCTPFRVNGEGWGWVVCPCMPPSCTYGAGRGGWGWGWRALVCLLPTCTGAARPMGEGGVGWRAFACPPPFLEEPGREGEGGGGVPSYAPLLCEWVAKGDGVGLKARGRRALRGSEGKGRGSMPSCAPPFYTRRGGGHGQCGEREDKGGGDLPCVR
ncbi:hypothetical protein EDB84DRAFT_1449218 [Lactarius hengduanensis]|nr:hypothetical protein EDB84DRAFT_1449218 [Lactarius hengduanensis]